MYGRNGIDQFSIALIVISLIVYIIYRITWFFPLYLVYIAIDTYVVFRTLSKNIPRRQLECQKWLTFTWKIKNLGLGWKIENWYREQIIKFEELKKYKKFKCPSCGQKIRIPRGRGKVEIICPKCKNVFVKKV